MKMTTIGGNQKYVKVKFNKWTTRGVKTEMDYTDFVRDENGNLKYKSKTNKSK